MTSYCQVEQARYIPAQMTYIKLPLAHYVGSSNVEIQGVTDSSVVIIDPDRTLGKVYFHFPAVWVVGMGRKSLSRREKTTLFLQLCQGPFGTTGKIMCEGYRVSW